MYIVIIGSGRTGSSLAGLLSGEGHEVVVVDKNNKKFKNLPVKFSGFTVEGDGMEHDVLKNAKIDQAEVLVITTGNDNINYMIAQLAQEIFEVSTILVRVIDPDKKAMFEEISAVQTFSQINLLVGAFSDNIKRIEG
jgi:trk system potassium uptake protein TrkA